MGGAGAFGRLVCTARTIRCTKGDAVGDAEGDASGRRAGRRSVVESKGAHISAATQAQGGADADRLDDFAVAADLATRWCGAGERCRRAGCREQPSAIALAQRAEHEAANVGSRPRQPADAHAEALQPGWQRRPDRPAATGAGGAPPGDLLAGAAAADAVAGRVVEPADADAGADRHVHCGSPSGPPSELPSGRRRARRRHRRDGRPGRSLLNPARGEDHLLQRTHAAGLRRRRAISVAAAWRRAAGTPNGHPGGIRAALILRPAAGTSSGGRPHRLEA